MTLRTSFKTPKGTELPLLHLKGKEYLQVAHRVFWMREEHPTWSIETQYIQATEKSAIAKAIIRDANGTIIAMSHKQESAGHFPDFLEKAETGAIGRALALCGYGTQFAVDDLDEAHRIVDGPQQEPVKVKLKETENPSPGFSKGVIRLGTHRGKPMLGLTLDELQTALTVLEVKMIQEGKTPLTLAPDWRAYQQELVDEIKGRMK